MTMPSCRRVVFCASVRHIVYACISTTAIACSKETTPSPAPAASGSAVQREAYQPKFKLGVLLSFSGEHGSKALDTRRGMEDALAKSPLPKEFGLVYQDARSVEAEDRNGAVELVDREQVIAILGDVIDSPHSRAIVDVAVARWEKGGASFSRQIPVLSPALLTDKEPEAPNGFFPIVATWEDEVANTYNNLIKARNIETSRVAIVSVKENGPDSATQPPFNYHQSKLLDAIEADKHAVGEALPIVQPTATDAELGQALRTIAASRPAIVYAPVTTDLALRLLQLMPDELRQVPWIGTADWYDLQRVSFTKGLEPPAKMPARIEVLIPDVAIESERCNSQWKPDAPSTNNSPRDRYRSQYKREPLLQFFIGHRAIERVHELLKQGTSVPDGGTPIDGWRMHIVENLKKDDMAKRIPWATAQLQLKRLEKGEPYFIVCQSNTQEGKQ